MEGIWNMRQSRTRHQRRPLKHTSPVTWTNDDQSFSEVTQQTKSSSGRPLDSKTRSSFEPSFGYSFGDIRIFADESAAELSQSVNARAFTLGNDMYFGADEYDPDTVEGQHLLAHELTHTIQQSRFGKPDGTTLSRAGDASEIEAQAAADSVMAGQAVAVTSRPTAAIARQDKDSEGGEEEESWWQKGLWKAAGILPGGIGKAITGTHGVKEAAGSHDIVKQISGIGEGLWSPIEAAGEMAGKGALHEVAEVGGGFLGALTGGLSAGADFAKGDYVKSIFDAGQGLLGVGQAGGSTLLGEGGAWNLLSTGALGEGSMLTADVGLGSLGSMGAAGLATTAGAVAAAGAGGALVGHELYEHTEVGEDAVGSIGGIDKAISSATNWLGIGPGKGKSATLALDDYRQEQWDKGGWGYLKGTGAMLGEAGIATAGAVGGLAEGAAHGVEAAGKGIAHGAEWLWDKL